MSNPSRSEIKAAIKQAIMRWQDATEAFDETVGELHGLGSAERRCLGFIVNGPQSASAIAQETMLSPAAITALVDRLEARGLVRRRADENDRRKVLVESTDKTRSTIDAAYIPVAKGGEALLESYTTKELEVVRRFMEDALALQQRITADLLSQGRKKGKR
ncbi:MAG TPA: MarR family transcriptional regulator [Burkholderiales bacterium]|jgi:DNA-binding MarR family transcriptional regulator